tara:strand:- start:37 stop:411 length:375 start_codon:yes stop_codon:yes gene_type:complete
MEKEFIPYEEALALKEFGFDEPCLGLYYGTSIKEEPEFLLEARSSQYYAEKGYVDAVLAPLYQQAFRWFREKYFIVGYIVPKNGKYTYHVTSNSIKLEMNSFKTYEEAELECLKKLIEIVKSQF